MMDVEVAVAGDLELGECPVWDADIQSLWWTDILRGAVLRHDFRDGADEEFLVDSTVGALGLHRTGSLLIATSDGFRLMSTRNGRSTLLAAVEDDLPDNRMNDGKVDPAGRFWAGTMSMSGRARAGTLYRLDPSGRATAVLPALTTSNGLAWSPDGRWMYHIDSPTKAVRRYQFDVGSGELGASSVLIDTSGHAGIPDGMAVDVEGGIWVCFWGGASVRRYDHTGRLLAEIDFPTTNPTSCCFGGSNLTDLFVTTARYGLNPEQIAAEPLSGSVMHLEVDVAGVPSVHCEIAQSNHPGTT
jgi:sugar lactone lactonase YvrE